LIEENTHIIRPEIKYEQIIPILKPAKADAIPIEPETSMLIKTASFLIFNLSLKGINIKTNPISYKNYPSPVKRPINAILNNNKFPKLRNWKEALKNYLLKK